jgi:hypothetical protein
MPNTERFVELQGYLAPDSIDACVVARDPWRGCNGLQLARDLRARLIGTVLVSDQVAEHLVQERLTVVPVGAAVRPGDLEAALMVAAQETWMLAAMMDAAAAQAPARARARDPWAEDEPTFPSPAEQAWSGVGAARPAQIAPSVTASLPTLELRLFGDLSGFEGPALEAPMPPRISARPPGPTPPPSWAGSTTRQVEVSASLLAQLAMDASGAPPAPPPPVPAPPAPPPPAAVPARRGPPPVPAPSGVWAAAMRTQEATQVDLLPPPRQGGWVAGITAEMTGRWLVWGAALLGVAVGMAVWLR